MVKSWQKLESQPAHDYRIFRTRWDTSRSPRTGKDHTFVVLEAGDWINVIPLTADNHIVFIHQYRHGTETVTLEVPGGMVDESDADPAVSAARELREETGYTCDEIIYLGSVEPNPAFLDNRCHTYLALNARQVATPQFDGAEDIVVEKFPTTAVANLITSGRITHALVVAAFYHFNRYQENSGTGAAR